jgi:hypothetical protein
MFPMHISQQVIERAVSADDTVNVDLGVRPLSAILINIKPLNDTGTLANWCNAIRIAASLTRVNVIARGQAIHSMRGEDLAAFNYFRWGMLPFLGNPDNVDNERRSVTLPIIMGRQPYMPSSCFPAMGKGELNLELTIDVAATGYDGFRYSVTTLELPRAKPTTFEKRVQQTYTSPATGINTLDLPVGNKLRGMMLWGTTGFDGASPAPSFSDVTVLKDNVEQGYRAVPWETLATLQMLKGIMPLSPSEDDHLHTTTTDGNAQTAVSTLGGGGFTRATTYRNYAFVDFDPTGDDEYALETADAKQCRLMWTAGTADAVRVVPIEVMSASQFS